MGWGLGMGSGVKGGAARDGRWGEMGRDGARWGEMGDDRARWEIWWGAFV